MQISNSGTQAGKFLCSRATNASVVLLENTENPSVFSVVSYGFPICYGNENPAAVIDNTAGFHAQRVTEIN